MKFAMTQSKPTTPRSRAHLAYVRTLPCAWCKRVGPSEASHHGTHGTALKPSDYAAIPLCTECHSAHHGARGIAGSHMTREQTRDWFVLQAFKVCERRLIEVTQRRATGSDPHGEDAEDGHPTSEVPSRSRGGGPRDTDGFNADTGERVESGPSNWMPGMRKPWE